jgi:hypothetical protein
MYKGGWVSEFGTLAITGHAWRSVVHGKFQSSTRHEGVCMSKDVNPKWLSSVFNLLVPS